MRSLWRSSTLSAGEPLIDAGMYGRARVLFMDARLMDGWLNSP